MNVIRKQRGAVIFENDCFCYICRDLLLVMISYCEHFTIGSLSANTQQLQWFTADVSCQCVLFLHAKFDDLVNEEAANCSPCSDLSVRAGSCSSDQF